jgi:twitching motility protein PilT
MESKKERTHIMKIEELLQEAVDQEASDVFIAVGIPPTFKVDGKLLPTDYPSLTPEDTEKFAMDLFKKEDQYTYFLEHGDKDFSLSIHGVGRFRVGVYAQRGSMSVIIRVLGVDNLQKLKINRPQGILDLHKEEKGLVLVTGPAGSGKSTTIAQILDLINRNRQCHIITIEDPIEYLFKHDQSIIEQREVGIDAKSFPHALKASLRHAPDVIFVSDLRDRETIMEAIHAAETGQLVISSLHTLGAIKTIERMVDIFSASQQNQIRYQLSTVLQTVVSQQLLLNRDNQSVLAFEVMKVNQDISAAIREDRLKDIIPLIESGGDEGMMTMEQSIVKLYHEGEISLEEAEKHCLRRESLNQLLRTQGK